MNLKKTLLLGLLLVGLFGYIWYVEIPSEKNEEASKLLIADLEREKLKEIEISSNEENIQLYFDKDWKVRTTGFPGAEPGTVSSLISALEIFRIDNAIPDEDIEADRALYGLNSPAIKIAARYKDENFLVSFGKMNDFTGKRYATVGDGSKIYLVSDELFSAASKSRSDFRDRTPLSFSDSELSSIRLKSSKREYIFITTADGSWRSEKPTTATISPAAIAELTRNLRNLTVKQFYDPKGDRVLDPKDFGFEKPVGIIEAKFKEGSADSELRINFGNKKRGEDSIFFEIVGMGSYFSLGSDPLPQLFKDFDKFREHSLFTFDPDSVIAVTFEQLNKEKLILNKSIKKADLPEWSVTEGANAGMRGELALIRGLLKDLSEVKAESFVASQGKYGFEAPLMKAEITLADNTSKILVVGTQTQNGKSKEAKSYFAAVGDLTEPFIISEATFNRIIPKKEVLIAAQDQGDTVK